ncbi:GNAT family N-acetyltransferase [Edaphobacillus lindanitolerans]|uniref:N-acetyltransferase domain-containing protein n=1 Tax=Edaphobacillus lindanitolerans TaxID=550447 RepID=A0A1U7PSE6_9BACI|nr:GNAT family N-acetyltransferase [Edaphobacillus lindanitolerans]SIT89198.1 hypothetical protein SAMN05428946_2380 [Edaphobacillus lindanitolerans]
MIRQLSEADRQQAMAFVGGQPAENLFIIGDIDAYGFSDPIQTLWGDFREDGTMRGILLRYTDNYIVWAPGEFDAEGFAGIFDADRSSRFLSGIEEVVRKVEPHLHAKPANPRVLYYAKCETAGALPDIPPEHVVRKAVPGDAAALIDQMYAIPEFADGDYSVEHKRRTLSDGTARAYLIERNGAIISSASSTAENPLSAMIVGVGTVPGHEKQGLATFCMSALCRELLEEGKMLCLFYDNPAAGSIYKRIGFKDIGKWCMWTFASEKTAAEA